MKYKAMYMYIEPEEAVRQGERQALEINTLELHKYLFLTELNWIENEVS